MLTAREWGLASMLTKISQQGLDYAKYSTPALTELYRSKYGSAEYLYAPLHREFMINALLMIDFGADTINQLKQPNQIALY
jgi:hypothetical protein